MENQGLLDKHDEQPKKNKRIKGLLIGLGGVVILCILAIVFVFYRDKIIKPVGAQGIIVFESDGDIYSIKPNGRDLKNLTESEFKEYDPQISPDGQYVAFVSDRDDGIGLYIVGKNGEGLRKVSGSISSISQTNYLWSPDSQSIIYESSRYSRNEDGGSIVDNSFFITSVQNQDSELIYQDGSNSLETNFLWSKDGKYIYISGDYSIIRLTLENLETQSIDVDFQISKLISLSPDGETLFYEDPSSVVYSVDVNGENNRYLDKFISDSGICWSADGKYIYYGVNNGDLMRLLMTESEEPEVFVPSGDGRYNVEVACSPDGKWLAYIDVAEYEYEVDAWDNIRELRLLKFSNGSTYFVTDFGSSPYWGQ